MRTLGMGTLDDSTVGAFCSFVRDDLTELIDPEDILEAEDFSKINGRLGQVSKDKEGNKRLDRLSTICTRLFIHLVKDDYAPGPRDQTNLCAFLTSEHIPNDLKVGLAMDISKEGSDTIREMLRSDQRVAKLLLESM